MNGILTSPYFWVPILVGIGIAALLGAGIRARGRDLNARFAVFGDPVGKSRAAIEATCGPASAMTAQPDGSSLVQWLAPGFEMSLVFDASGRCLSVQRQFSADGLNSVPPPLATPEEARMPLLMRVIVAAMALLVGGLAVYLVAYNAHLIR